MRLLQLDLENFRRIKKATVCFEPSTFIVGPNNTSKSSIVAAIEALLSLRERNCRNRIYKSGRMAHAQIKQSSLRTSGTFRLMWRQVAAFEDGLLTTGSSTARRSQLIQPSRRLRLKSIPQL